MQRRVARRLGRDPHRLGELGRATSPRTSASTGPRGPGGAARRRRRVPPPGDAAGAGPDRGDGQRGHPDEGHRHAARGRSPSSAPSATSSCCWWPVPQPGGATERLVERLAIGDAVRFVHGINDDELAATVASAEVACVPSLYEGFSLPTVEAMACATPLVVSRAGAIPEVVGPEGSCADLVTPGDVGELVARPGGAARRPRPRARMGAAGRARALGRLRLASGRRDDRRGLPRGDRRDRPPRLRRSTPEETMRC